MSMTPSNANIPSKDQLPTAKTEDGQLERSISFPWLVFYGVGVTVGAGIFALIGEIVAIAGDNAPLAFLVSGLIAGITGVSYMQLIQIFPKAGGEAVFAHEGLGRAAGRVAGLGVVATGTISSAVISIAFAGYVRSLVDLPTAIVTALLLFMLAAIAIRGIKESVVFAAVITVLEVGTLLVIIGYGASSLGDHERVLKTFTPGQGGFGLTPIFAGAVVAFFAFVGFEDIANMAEETVNPTRTAPRAIAWTLGITISLYVLLATIVAVSTDRQAVADSDAPLATLFESLSGIDARFVAAIAVVAMINGALVQIVMASRVLYGMAREGLVPQGFATVDPVRHTPVRATVAIVAAVLGLALFFPLVGLARLTSVVTLMVFALVNMSLVMLGNKEQTSQLRRWRWHGISGAALCLALAGWEVLRLI